MELSDGENEEKAYRSFLRLWRGTNRGIHHLHHNRRFLAIVGRKTFCCDSRIPRIAFVHATKKPLKTVKKCVRVRRIYVRRPRCKVWCPPKNGSEECNFSPESMLRIK